jgi:hypothetical protein
MLQTAPIEQENALWRRQCARNLMDCYRLSMAMSQEVRGQAEGGQFERCAQACVAGVEKIFQDAPDLSEAFRMASQEAAMCAEASESLVVPRARENARLYRIHAQICERMAQLSMGNMESGSQEGDNE